MGGLLRILFVLILAGCGFSWLQSRSIAHADVFGPFGPEGARMREQLWILPGADPRFPLRATMFRPTELEDRGAYHRRPLVIINHGTDAATRESVSMPVFYWLSRWFVERGYVVILPQRRGHGATGGEFLEGTDSCARPDHAGAAEAAADDIEPVLHYMRRQPFIDPDATLLVGVSTGAWASLAVASRGPQGLTKIINFAGGRGAYAWGQPRAICDEPQLVKATAAFARSASVPTLWLYAQNDSYFPPRVADSMAKAWNSAGGHAELHILPPYGAEGHALVDDRAGWNLWGPIIDRFIAVEPPVPAALLAKHSPSSSLVGAAEGN